MQTANIHRPGPGDCLPLRTQDNEGRRIVGLLGHSTGGRPGERLIRRLAMPISDDTILRHLKRYASWVDDEPPARIIGIDDWSWRKSRRYGTIIVDLERRKVMDSPARLATSRARRSHPRSSEIWNRAISIPGEWQAHTAAGERKM
jgi:hypothetical protein